MTEWIPGKGFWLVQATTYPTPEELKAEMNELELNIQAAERYHENKKRCIS